MSERTVNPSIFTRPRSKLSTQAVTISIRGGFMFSAGFCHAFDVQKNKHCVLGYDSEEKAICFQFVNTDDSVGAIRMTHRTAGNSSIQSGSFFVYYKLDPKALAGRYPLIQQSVPEKGSWFVAFLDQKVS